MHSPRIWFITGASTGFGYHLTCVALEEGDKVVATMRNPDSGGQQLRSQFPIHVADGRLLILKLDVKNSQAISEAFGTAKEKYGRIDAVFNNAGRGVIGEFEGIPEESARELFDTNFWGAANVTKESVKAFRENSPPGGRLLQNSSFFAIGGQPGAAYYAATKAALESISESLVAELDPAWNIKITDIQPGFFKTNMMSENLVVLPSPSAYSPDLAVGALKAVHERGDLSKMAGDPVKAVKLFYQLSTLENPPAKLPVHPVSITASIKKAEAIFKEVEEYKSWSDDIF